MDKRQYTPEYNEAIEALNLYKYKPLSGWFGYESDNDDYIMYKKVYHEGPEGQIGWELAKIVCDKIRSNEGVDRPVLLEDCKEYRKESIVKVPKKMYLDE